MTEQEVARNFNDIRRRIAEAEMNAGRKPGSVTLCAVSKFHPVTAVYDAIKCNQLLFGENRVQEAYKKFIQINEDQAIVLKPELHIIGTLQLNKVKHAVMVASCIQSIDREEVLVEIEKQCQKMHKTIKIFFEYHTGEASKSGYLDYEKLRTSVKNCAEGMYPHIIPNGFMTMAPFTHDEETVRASFKTMREIATRLKESFPLLPLTELSMGMSDDYAIAIQEGSTMVRIGTALFGPRETSEEIQ